MDDKEESLHERLVIGRKRDGRRLYDEAAKEELIQACLRPGASIARTAMEHGVNPNLVRSWISARQRKDERSTVTTVVTEPSSGGRGGFDGVYIDVPAAATPTGDNPKAPFVPVVATPALATTVPPPPTLAIALHVRLPNGVEFDLGEASLEELTTIVQMLGRMPCSGSMTI